MDRDLDHQPDPRALGGQEARLRHARLHGPGRPRRSQEDDRHHPRQLPHPEQAHLGDDGLQRVLGGRRPRQHHRGRGRDARRRLQRRRQRQAQAEDRRQDKGKPDKGGKLAAGKGKPTPRPRAARPRKTSPSAATASTASPGAAARAPSSSRTCRTSSTSRAAMPSMRPTGTTSSAPRAATAASTSLRSTLTASSCGPTRRCPGVARRHLGRRHGRRLDGDHPRVTARRLRAYPVRSDRAGRSSCKPR